MADLLSGYLSEDWVSPKIETMRASSIHGRGMFAVGPFTRGETVVVWGGTFVRKDAAERAEAEGKLVMQLDEDLYSVEVRGEALTYFMNHSCDSNVWMADAVTLVARRDIVPGEELTLDYALVVASEDFTMPGQCVCGSRLCRKRITGRDWRLLDVQRRYAEHFSPLIANRIRQVELERRD